MNTKWEKKVEERLKHPFKVGDTVLCTNACSLMEDLQEGQYYPVLETRIQWMDPDIRVSENGEWYRANRFQLKKVKAIPKSGSESCEVCYWKETKKGCRLAFQQLHCLLSFRPTTTTKVQG